MVVNEIPKYEQRRTLYPEDVYNIKLHENDTLPYNEKRYIVLKSKGRFYMRLAWKRDYMLKPFYHPHAGKAHGVLYRPPYPSMTKDDIEGATYAWDDGTHWWFAHCSPHEHVDYAIESKTFAMQQFQTLIAKTQLKIHEAGNRVVEASVRDKLKAIIKFSEDVGDSVYDTVIGQTLGFYHRNPHNDHRRELAYNAIRAVLTDWKKEALTNTATARARTAILSDANLISTELAKDHTIEWRHVRQARLDAAKKANEQTSDTESE